MNELKGLGTALITPFDANGKVDYEALERLLETQLKGFVDYIVVLGTTGEAATMTEDEKQEVRTFIVNYVRNHPISSLVGRSGGVWFLQLIAKTNIPSPFAHVLVWGLFMFYQVV